MASPQRLPHGRYANKLASILDFYETNTPGVEAASGSTVILGDESEPQPDHLLRVLPECGGRSWTDGLYVAGPPELVIEIAHSTVAIELHAKKDDYEQNGILEYVVVCVAEKQIHWFDLAKHKSSKLATDGVLRSKAFPGLWIDARALFQLQTRPLLRALNDGLASPEHARFVRRLARARKQSGRQTKHGERNGKNAADS